MNAIATSTRSVVGDFIAAVNQHDRDQVLALVTADCMIEIPTAPPAGIRFETQPENQSFWTDVLSADEESLSLDPSSATTEDRAVIRWRSVRQHGIYIVRVRDGTVSELMVYGWD